MSKPHYAKLEKPEPDEKVIRYTSLAQLIWIVTRKELPLIRVDLFRDPFEGSAPQSVIDSQIVLAGGRAMFYQQQAVEHHYRNVPAYPALRNTSGDLWAEMTARRKARTYSTYASCWRWGSESEGMWRLYCGEKDGVALQTTFARLEQSIEEEQILAGKIRYADYKTMPPFSEEIDSVMHKRQGFAFEQEVRLLKVDQDLYIKLCAGEQHNPPGCQALRWSITAAIDRILVSPYADDWYMDAVRAALRLSGVDIAERIVWSELREKPQF